MQKITTYLWFNGNAEQAVEHYCSIFPRSKVTQVARWGEGGPGPAGSVMNIAFELDGQRAGRVAQALMSMQKIDLAALERAHQGA